MFFGALTAMALITGCAHRGGVSDVNYRDTGYGRSADDYGPTRPSTTDRDFPGRIGPGSDRVDPALPRY
jgi:hypothetical protein